MSNLIEELRTKLVVQMTEEDLMQIVSMGGLSASGTEPVKYAYGMRALGDAIGCSLSTVYDLKKNGVLNDAVVSFVGRKIAFDVEKARALADRYKSEQRAMLEKLKNELLEQQKKAEQTGQVEQVKPAEQNE